MDHKQNKLENPERLAELSPKETLMRIGLGEQDIICDIGAGSGIFTVPAARITKNTVFALETNDEFLEIIKEKAVIEDLPNIITMKVTGDHYDIQPETVDVVILVTVLHEIEDKNALLTEFKRIMKNNAKLAVIEFHKRQTPMGPPVAHRLSKEEVAEMCGQFGFVKTGDFDLGENLYCVLLESI
ncbi:MAG: methyltransferase domain-containing protein [Eubacteriales bacterium]